MTAFRRKQLPGPTIRRREGAVLYLELLKAGLLVELEGLGIGQIGAVPLVPVPTLPQPHPFRRKHIKP
jgi:hypothetical protein